MNGTMRLHEEIQPVTVLKTRAARLLRSLAENRRPVVITQSGEPRGVLIDVETYEDLRDATVLLKLLARGEADVRAGKTVAQDDVFRTARERLRRD